jgi:hypothetical protein
MVLVPLTNLPVHHSRFIFQQATPTEASTLEKSIWNVKLLIFFPYKPVGAKKIEFCLIGHTGIIKPVENNLHKDWLPK